MNCRALLCMSRCVSSVNIVKKSGLNALIPLSLFLRERERERKQILSLSLSSGLNALIPLSLIPFSLIPLSLFLSYLFLCSYVNEQRKRYADMTHSYGSFTYE